MNLFLFTSVTAYFFREHLLISREGEIQTVGLLHLLASSVAVIVQPREM
jgi:hypothetical protein